MKRHYGAALAGLGAGILNGLFGAGGGMVLSPLLTQLTDLDEETVFPCSVAILFPICMVSLLFSRGWANFSIQQALPYLIGSALGGVCAGFLGKRIPTGWLHKVLGILILWGGLRYLW
jgi:uncharacterized membrane protein YfcA